MNSMVARIQVPLDSLAVGGDRPEQRAGYGLIVAKQLKALRDRSGLTSEAMADAMAAVLGRPVGLVQISRWENAHQEPRASILLAAMQVAGLPMPEDAPKDPRRALERELEELQRQVDMLSRRVVFPDQLPILPPSHRQRGRYLSVAQAAHALKLSRQAVYDRIARKELRAFAWSGKTVLLVDDVKQSE